MRNLDLNTYGIQSMSKEEIQKINGGIIGALALGFLGTLIYDICKDPSDSWSSFSAGMRDGLK